MQKSSMGVGLETLLERSERWANLETASDEYHAKRRYLRNKHRKDELEEELEQLYNEIGEYERI